MSNYIERREIEEKLEDYLLNMIKEPEHINNIELINVYALVRIANELEKLDLNGVTPIDALNILYRLKEKL